jgi:hypothetical protein
MKRHSETTGINGSLVDTRRMYGNGHNVVSRFSIEGMDLCVSIRQSPEVDTVSTRLSSILNKHANTVSHHPQTNHQFFWYHSAGSDRLLVVLVQHTVPWVSISPIP